MAVYSIVPALMYLLYTLLFLTICLMLGRTQSAEISQAMLPAFTDTPFRRDPDLTLKSVTGPAQVYEWVSNVFLPVTYADSPTPLDRSAYCSNTSKCAFGEGDVSDDRYCAIFLKAGKNNCPSFMGAGRACCEACVDSTSVNCPNFKINTLKGDLTDGTSVEDVSDSCDTPVQAWVPDLSQWTRTITAAGRRLQTDFFDEDASEGDFTYCPERLSKVPSDLESRTASPGNPVTLGTFNRLLLGRITLKRINLVDQGSQAFSNAYPKTRADYSTSASSYYTNIESTESFGETGKTMYSYEYGKGFSQAGGFIKYLDFRLPKEQIRAQIEELKRAHWFDLGQGSFVLELLSFNANNQQFFYVAFVFEHNFAGRTNVWMQTAPIDLTLHQLDQTGTWVRFVIYCIVLGLYVAFVKNEWDEFRTEYSVYLSDIASLHQAFSLLLTFVCIVVYLTICVSYTYLHWSLPMSNDEDMRHQEFEDMATLASNMDQFYVLLSINMFLIFLRCFFLLSTVVPQLDVVLQLIKKTKFSLIAFSTVYCILILGAGIGAHCCFGNFNEAYSSVGASLVATSKLVLGDHSDVELQEGVSSIPLFYFVVMSIVFALVQQLLLCIIVSGLAKHMAEADIDKEWIFVWWKNLKHWVVQHSQCIQRCVLPIRVALFGHQQSAVFGSVNFELLALLQDFRSTRPRTRRVTYQSRQDVEGEEAQDNTIAKDIILHAVPPCFEGGLVQYYVDWIQPNSPANDAHVTPGFRLIEIQQGNTSDREKFRQLNDLGEPQDPNQILKNLKRFPVTLTFEGKARPALFELCLLITLGTLWFTLAYAVMRIPDSFSMGSIHESALVRPTWLAHKNAIHDMSFGKIGRMAEVQDWVSATVVDNVYSCVGEVGQPAACGPDGSRAAPRDGWFLWHGIGNSAIDAIPTEAKLVKPLDYRPPASDGLSLGYVPLTPPAASEAIETACASDNDQGDFDCPECVMDQMCVCNGEVRYGYGNNWTRWTVVNKQINCSIAYFKESDPLPGHGKLCMCRPTVRPVDQTVRLQEHNVGVLTNNFAQLSFQVPCFKHQTNERYKGGYDLIWYPNQEDAWFDAASGEDCLDQQGEFQGITDSPGQLFVKGAHRADQVKYEVTPPSINVNGEVEDQDQHERRTIGIGFGGSRGEASVVEGLLRDGNIFAHKAASAVFEIVGYNGNFDLFTRVSVAFKLRSTGLLEKDVVTNVFPLNVLSMGNIAGAAELRVWNWICFFLFCGCSFLHMGHLFRSFLIQYRITKCLQRSGFSFFMDWFVEDFWNVIELGICVSSFTMIGLLLTYIFEKSSFKIQGGLETWIGTYGFNAVADLNTVDQGHEFAHHAAAYATFKGASAICGMCITVRLTRALRWIAPLRLLLRAVSMAAHDLIILSLIIICMLAGFGLMAHARLGVQLDTFSTPGKGLMGLILILLGNIDDAAEEIGGQVFWAFMLVSFQVIMYVILSTGVAIIIYYWRLARRDAEEESLTQFLIATFMAIKRMADDGGLARLSTLATATAKRQTEEEAKTYFDIAFWRSLSILQFLPDFDETSGQFKADEPVAAQHAIEKAPKRKHKAKQAQEEEEDDDDDGPRGLDFKKAEDLKRFHKAFRKSYMDVSVRLCKDVPDNIDSIDDDGAGVGDMNDEAMSEKANPRLVRDLSATQLHVELHEGVTGVGVAAQKHKKDDKGKSAIFKGLSDLKNQAQAAADLVLGQEEEEDTNEFKSYIDAPQTEAVRDGIRKELRLHLTKSEQPSEEVWLDALLTILEEAECLERLRDFFEPMPMPRPNRPKEWKEHFERIGVLEKRLLSFLLLVRAEARRGYNIFLKEMAEAKEKVLKQQSLVLTDYLETLDQQIQHVQEEMQRLEAEAGHTTHHS